MATSKALNINNDIFVQDGRFAIVRDGAETVQILRSRLRFFKGEWFLDLTAGIPYFQEILKKPVDLASVEAIIKSEILNTDNIESITRFQSSFEGNTRKLTVEFDAITTFGVISGVTINV